MSDAARQVHMLPVEQSVVLLCIRTWVVGLHHDIGAATRIKDLMGRIGAEQATSYLDGFMVALGEGAKRKIVIDRIGQAQVGADERVLLGILAYAQENRPSEASLLLRAVVKTAATPAVLRSAGGLAAELAFAGHFLLAADLAMPPAYPRAASLH